MSEPFLLRGLLAMGVWFLEATGVLLVASVIAFLYRKNASRCHLTWLTAFAVLLLIPGISSVIPTHFAVVIPLPARGQALALLREPPPSLSPYAFHAARETKSATILDKQKVDLPAKPVGDTKAVPASQFRYSWTPLMLGLLGVWLVGIAAIGFQGVSGLYGIAMLRRRSLPSSCTSLDLHHLADKVGLNRQWELRVSAAPTPPTAMTWGVLRPVILLPRESGSWSGERLEVVLLHELAHVRRCDSLSQLLALCVCALFWFHPAVWLCARAMRAAAEGAADDTVLCAGVKPSVYAAELLRFAAQLGRQNQSFASISVSIMKCSRIETRIKSIVDPSRSRRGATLWEVLKAVGFGSLMLLMLSSLRPSVSSAQERHDTPDTRAAVRLPHKALTVVRSHRIGTIWVIEPHLAKMNDVPAAREQRSPADHQEPSQKGITLRNLTDQRKSKTSHNATVINVYSAVDPASADRVIAEVDAKDALLRQRNARKTSHKYIVRRADVQASATFLSRQRAMAIEDMQRGAGNTHGIGEAREAKVLKRTAEILEAAHDPASAARAIAEADAKDALQRQ